MRHPSYDESERARLSSELDYARGSVDYLERTLRAMGLPDVMIVAITNGAKSPEIAGPEIRRFVRNAADEPRRVGGGES